MKLLPEGALIDHNGQKVPYRLTRDDEDAARWLCSIDPHQQGQYSPAGSGKSHAEAVRKAREWWESYDCAQ